MYYLKQLENELKICLKGINGEGVERVFKQDQYETIKYLYDYYRTNKFDIDLFLKKTGYRIKSVNTIEKEISSINYSDKTGIVNKQNIENNYYHSIALILLSLILVETKEDKIIMRKLKWNWLFDLLYPNFVLADLCILQCLKDKDLKENDVLNIINVETLDCLLNYNIKMNNKEEILACRIVNFNENIKKYILNNKRNKKNFSLDTFVNFLEITKERSRKEYKEWVLKMAESILSKEYKEKFFNYVTQEEEKEEKEKNEFGGLQSQIIF